MSVVYFEMHQRKKGELQDGLRAWHVDIYVVYSAQSGVTSWFYGGYVNAP